MPCPIGTYQDQKWQYTCISCGGHNYRTDFMAATSPRDCKFRCPAGYTPTNNQTSCVPCPRGTYQPKKDATDCMRCAGDKVDTRQPGATSDKQCEVFCDSGYEKLSNGSCSICAIGFFKNNSIDTFQTCTRCSDPRFVTPHEGAVGEMLCTVLNCTEGTRINYAKRVCEDCPLGTYQDEPYQTTCKNCSAGMSTRNNGTRLASDCETFCQNGFEKNSVTDMCDECQRGFYKNNNNYVFMDCTLCPTEYVTLNNGSSQLSDCIVRNCTPGQYIAMGGINCNLCDYGLYQPYWWQSQCLKCPQDRTTQRLGAISLSECILSCPPGKENKPGAYNCTPCEQGFFKSKEAAASCDKCPVGTTTRDGGATDQSECDQTACEAGSIPSKTDPKMCARCPFATYQPLRWQQECIRCPAGYTTLVRGATSNSSCILDCPAGQQYLENETRCEKCPIGFYNTDLNPESSTCVLCSLDLITPSTGSTSERDCSIRNCSLPGQYRDPLANECRDCPRGQWQDQKWQTGCMSCPPGTTTHTQAATSEQDCQQDCAEGMELRNGQCEKCLVGEYRNKSQSWECQPCPAGLTTQTIGSSSLTDCLVLGVLGVTHLTESPKLI
ncbi:proprotein convertase subtilisin/kexin type 5-like [Pomacea canaliculata]|uniref:proprotein convertase subtilisin/kexin type 5-like n=1 Tax=Pomacea canaliculata TaxID=400727 RepID=UPI000D72790F|nr:proprotein convertase subtilisin/kexin type 5-like [Pomacea canaliculata]